MMADIGDMVIYSYGCSPVGNQKVVMSIGSKAEDPERLAAFVDWLYSPEGIRNNRAQTSGGMAGPEGLCWEYGEDGPYLTDFGKKPCWARMWRFRRNGGKAPGQERYPH